MNSQHRPLQPPHTRRRTPVWIFMVVLAIVVFVAQYSLALDVPTLQGRVNDYAHMLSAHTARQLEAELAGLEQSDSTQIVVLTVDSLQGDAIEDFSIRVAEAWGIGQEGKDNGALLIIAKKDRKIRIEVGYGLEGKLTDLMSGRIIRNVIGPEFKLGRFDQGIINGVAAMVGVVRGEYTASKDTRSSHRRHNGASPGLIGLITLFFLLRMVGRVNRSMGAVTGAVVAPIAGALFFNAGLFVILALVPIGLGTGLLAGLFGAPLSYSHTATRSRHTGFWGGGGGFSSGGGFGGFSGGGGGFGGGGASGGW